MNKLSIFKLPVIGLAILAAIAVFGACSSTVEPQDRSFGLQIANGALNQESDTLVVNEGDNVNLQFTTDAPGSVHLHGYDIEKLIAPGKAMSIEFLADATGRFNFTFHPSMADAGHDMEGDEHDEHAGLFESDTLGNGDSFSFAVPHDLHGEAITFHNHMKHEASGMFMVDDAGEAGTIAIEVEADGHFHPHEVTVQPGATLVWTNAGEDRARIASGKAPTVEGTEEHEHDEGAEEGEEGEEISLGAIEVHPR